MPWNWTNDPATPVGLLRLLIPDRQTPDQAPGPLFWDEELAGLLALEGQSVRRAAATAKELIATDQTLLLKVLQIGTQRTNGAALGAELREQAKQLRAEAEFDDAAAGLGFDWAEQVLDPATARQRLWDQAERQMRS